MDALTRAADAGNVVSLSVLLGREMQIKDMARYRVSWLNNKTGFRLFGLCVREPFEWDYDIEADKLVEWMQLMNVSSFEQTLE
jgi:hypothetical protein